MPRTMKPAPDQVLLAKTTRGSWIALEEIWSEDGELLEVRPMRPAPGQPIIQARERRDILARVENALMKSRLRELERKLQDFTNGASPGVAGVRYAATG